MFAASGGAVSSEKTYVEDVFSTYLYTGNSSTQTINNGIDLAGKGGMVWLKHRSTSGRNTLFDTVRGTNKLIHTDTTFTQNWSGNPTDTLTSFNSNGFSLGADNTIYGIVNNSSTTYSSWTFRKAPKFFDVVTWTGNDVDGRQINHSLGQKPGMIIVKKTNGQTGWPVYHRSTTASDFLWLETTDVAQTFPMWNNTEPTETTFTVSNHNSTNAGGGTYVAYIFAHDTTTDGLIQCGSFDNTNAVDINLGWEPQYVMIKNANSTSDWFITDNMRGMPVGSPEAYLRANTSTAEGSTNMLDITPTGFRIPGGGYWASNTIYMAIRRGPMRTPTDGTKVFMPVAQNGASTVTTGFPVDTTIMRDRTTSLGYETHTRLQGSSYLLFNSYLGGTGAESNDPNSWKIDSNTGFTDSRFASAAPMTYLNFKRAPGFFDVVCYTGTGATQTVNHNLGVAPELMIVKGRNNAFNWYVYHSGVSAAETKYVVLNDNIAAAAGGVWNNTAPTSTNFSLGGAAGTNQSTYNYVAYLFASCPGVSKVGSYTGTGTYQTINCGFTNGARFVLIKRTDSTGNWTVWDTARGISSSADPSIKINTTAAEDGSTNYLNPDPTGFQINLTEFTDINAIGATYIYLAIA